MSDTRSRASSFQQRFNNFTQWTMQKLGRAEETKLDPEFENRVAKFRATKKELVALLKAASSFHTAKMKLQKANEGFHDALAMTGSHAKASPEVIPAVSATQSYVTAGRALDSEEAKFNDAYKTIIHEYTKLAEMVDAIVSLLEKEVKECELALKKHSTAHLEFDSCNRKWKKMEGKPRVTTVKKQALEEELKRKAKTFNDMGHQVINLTSIVESKKNTILHENLERFMQAQQQFFEKASKYMIDGDSLKSKLEEARGDEAEGGGEKGAESKGNDGEEEEHDVKDDVKETKKEG